MKVTKKLKDVTYEELKEWYRINCDNHCNGCIFDNVYCCIINSNHQWIHHKDLYSDKFLNQTIEVAAPDILDKEEKEYLSVVIKPFRDRIISIGKITTSSNNREAILITYTESPVRAMRLPDFPKGTMYKDMSNGIEYKLEELGL